MGKDKPPLLDRVSSFFNQISDARESELPVNVNDVTQPFTSGMSQREMDAYDAYLKNNSGDSTGQLPLSAYYPDAGNNIAVGNYSGRVVGSNTIYAPGGGLVPLGMIDARQKALEDAALAEAKNVEDFRKQFKAPTSDLVNINEDLSNKYFAYVESGWEKALKAAKGDPNKAIQLLKMDVEFQRGLKSYEDLAKEGSVIAKSIAFIDQGVKEGKLISPSLRAAKERVLRIADPESPEFKNLSAEIRNLRLEQEFNDEAINVMKNIAQQVTGTEQDLSNPESYRIFKETISQFTPEMKEYAKNTMLKAYEGSDLYTPDQIIKNMDALMSNVNKTQGWDIKAKPQDKTEGDAYDAENDIIQEDVSDNVYVKGRYDIVNKETGEPVLDEKGNKKTELGVQERRLSSNYSLTHKTPTKLAAMPSGARVYINDKENGLLASTKVASNTGSELFKTQVVKVADVPGSTADGTPLTDDQIEEGFVNKKGERVPYPFKYESMTSGVYVNDKGQEVQFYVPTRQAENALVKKRDPKTKKVFKGVPVDDFYQEAERRNKELKSTKKEADKEAMITVKLPDGRVGEIPAAKWEAFKKSNPKAVKVN
jgi:hypothetical protein